MRTLLFILLFSVSLTAQNKQDATVKQGDVFMTTVNGKSSYDGNIEMTKNDVLNGQIALQSDAGKAAPAIIALEVFIPGQPAIYIKGDKLDEATKEKIRSIASDNVVAIRGVVAHISADKEKNHKIGVANITLKG